MALVLVACAGQGRARADDTGTTAERLVVVVESSDVAVGGAAVRNALGARLERPVASLLDDGTSHTGLTLAIAVDRRRQQASVRLTDGGSRGAERSVGLPRPSAAAVAAIVDVCATLLAERASQRAPFGGMVRDVLDPFSALPPPRAPPPEVLSPWPEDSASPATRPPLARWPAGAQPSSPTTTTPRPTAIEPASALSAPEPGFTNSGEP